MLGIRAALPVIMCAGYSDVVGPQEAMRRSVRQMLLKPVGKDELRKVVNRVLQPRG